MCLDANREHYDSGVVRVRDAVVISALWLTCTRYVMASIVQTTYRYRLPNICRLSVSLQVSPHQVVDICTVTFRPTRNAAKHGGDAVPL